MNIGDIIYTVLIGPLQVFFEYAYMLAYKTINNPGLSIIALSLAMNILVLPLYMRADAMQEEEREIEQRLSKGVAHIKKSFKGDERMMILDAYYRQNNYKPTYVFKSALSLFLEIPFFIAAYQFLSHLEVIQGISFGILSDLGKADQLLSIGGLNINVLPFVMTGVNLISCVLFTKGYPLKTKIQLYSMAIFFLIFLYNSPSGLVFYWTLNNLFSLGKTICYKVYDKYKNSEKKIVKEYAYEPNKKLFYSMAGYLTVLVGLITSTLLKASPQEFIDKITLKNPVWYSNAAILFAFGLFVVWFGVFYSLANNGVKKWFEAGITGFACAATVEYFFFGRNFGILTNTLVYEEGLYISRREEMINLMILIIVFIIAVLLVRFFAKAITKVSIVPVIALLALSIFNLVGVNNSVVPFIAESSNKDTDSGNVEKNMPQITLSKDGKNVMVIMLDRAMNEYMPYLVQEKPELKEMYSGFTYYSNVISFGAYTNFGTPCIFGGYEYTPLEMNKRDDMLLVEKQNEALKLMPLMFDKNGYDVTVFDPPYANYQWAADLSIFDEYPDIKAYASIGAFWNQEESGYSGSFEQNKRNFYRYSLMKILPLACQTSLYDDGRYLHWNSDGMAIDYSGQGKRGLYESKGVSANFQESYAVLENMINITDFTNDGSNKFFMMQNDCTHDPIYLQAPDFVPAQYVNNIEYESQHKERIVDGVTLKMEDEYDYTHYYCDMAALLRLGEWFDYLKENGVYDNTRIIIVADHGRDTAQLDSLLKDNGDEIEDLEFFYPLLLVKDFDAKEYSVSEEFMTQSDVPYLAVDGVIDNPVNPFTGRRISDSYKKENPLYVLSSGKYDTSENNGYRFLPGNWYTVKDDMRNADNWTFIKKDSDMPY